MVELGVGFVAVVALLAVIAVNQGVFETPPVPAGPHRFNAEDLVDLDRVSDPHLSPDGSTVVYDVRSTDLDRNRTRHGIWTVCITCGDGAAGDPLRLAVSDGGATNPRWSPDGKAIFFLSSRSGSQQVWRADTSGGHPTQVTNLPIGVENFAITPNQATLVVALAVFPDCETPACTHQRLDAVHAAKPTGRLYTKLFIRHWDEWADGTRNHLFALHLNDKLVATGDALALTPHFDGDVPSKPFGDDTDFAISPDSRTLIFSARLAGSDEPWSTNFDLYEVRLDGSEKPRDLTSDNPAWDATPVFSPDGKRLAYRAQKRPGFEADRFAVMVRDLDTGATREVDPDWDRSIDRLAWSADGKRLYVTLDDLGHKILATLDPETGTHTALTTDGHVGDIAVGAKTVVFERDTLAAPPELYKLDGAALTRITSNTQHQMLNAQLAGYEQFTFWGWNNELVHGYVMLPVGYNPVQKYPVAFIIHGGPQSTFSDAWSFRWNPQFYAGAGYASVFIDFHGSTGYGQDFTDSISGHWGDRPLEDLQRGWDAALAKYPFLDGNRACALGASYGGYMVYWIAGNWNTPWRCLVDHDGVFDNRMMGYSTEELWFSEWENGHVPPFQEPATYERFNPVNHVDDWQTPMLVIHSANDFRIPLDQGVAAFTALQRKGIPSEFLTFPDENHWVLKPQNSLQWHATVRAWLDRWTAKPEEGGRG
jgi:acylaminoacyl-peptidase